MCPPLHKDRYNDAIENQYKVIKSYVMVSESCRLIILFTKTTARKYSPRTL